MAKTKPYVPTKSTNSLKGSILYIFLLPLFLAIIMALMKSNIMDFILNSVAFLLFFITAKLSSKGFAQERDYLQAKLTKAPKIPYKSLSAFGLGISTFFTMSIAGGESFFVDIFLGIIATVGYFLYYGFDPRDDKLENIGDISAEFVLETISEARGKIVKIEKDSKNIKDKELVKMLWIATKKADIIIDTIQEDPKDIRVSRKFLIVYIDGIVKVTESYIAMDEKDIDSDTKERLYTLMRDLDKKFDDELQRLKENNMFDLDVSIDALKEHIK
ncbi:MAG: 5-bromo-4-chloroindolyl phosphate hydrolysis family protein [Sulfurovum sp.]